MKASAATQRAGLHRITFTGKPTRRSAISPASDRRLTSRCAVASGRPSFRDSSDMVYSVPECRRSTVSSSAWCCDRRIGMRAGASARIDGRYDPLIGSIQGAERLDATGSAWTGSPGPPSRR